MTQCALFIADLHLSVATSQTTKLFFEFLDNIPTNAEALYILGDLFQFWAGDDDCSAYNQELKARLKVASEKLPIYLMPGNRDFLLGEKFAQESGCILIGDPYVINLYGKATVLTHGDLLCGNNSKYSFFRKLIRFPYGIKLFLKLPLKLRRYIAQQMQKCSAYIKFKSNKPYVIARAETIKFLTDFQAQQIIHGHIHMSETEEFQLNGMQVRRISLEEWQDNEATLIYYADY